MRRHRITEEGTRSKERRIIREFQKVYGMDAYVALVRGIVDLETGKDEARVREAGDVPR